MSSIGSQLTKGTKLIWLLRILTWMRRRWLSKSSTIRNTWLDLKVNSKNKRNFTSKRSILRTYAKVKDRKIKRMSIFNTLSVCFKEKLRGSMEVLFLLMRVFLPIDCLVICSCLIIKKRERLSCGSNLKNPQLWNRR